MDVRLSSFGAAVTAGLMAAAIGGCGRATAPRRPPAGSIKLSTVPSSAAEPVTGLGLFVEHCQLCHSMTGHPSPTQQGGDLSTLRTSRRELTQLTVEMPVIHGRLNAAQVRAVVNYMISVERRR
jgi:mono/diheme cytochrome c family protein